MEMVKSDKKFAGAQFDVQAMGMIFYWSLNQELLFSAALTGKPVRKEDYAEYSWARCVVRSREDYVEANKFLSGKPHCGLEAYGS